MISSKVRPTGFYHPIKIIFLDDNRAFLDALDLEFSTQINMVTHTNPNAALQEIDKSAQNLPSSIVKLMHDSNDNSLTNRIVCIEAGNIFNIIYDKLRFDRIALLVVDYDMPDINGIEFCKKLKDKKVFRIMLTAAADKDTAIQAFNGGLIDKFILKNNEELYSEIRLALQELTQRNFMELSNNITAGQSNLINKLFNNEAYKSLFLEVASQADAVEYYMVDNSGSFLFLDKDANPTWLIVRDNQELDEQILLLQGYDLPAQLMESILQKEKILFLFSEKEYKKPIASWIENMYDSRRLDEHYHYSVVQHQLTDSIDWDRVIPYSTYIAEMNGTSRLFLHSDLEIIFKLFSLLTEIPALCTYPYVKHRNVLNFDNTCFVRK